MSVPAHSDKPVCEGCEHRLKGAHPYMAEWFRKKKSKYINLHCSWVYRSRTEQEIAFTSGASDVHYPHSKHNYTKNSMPCSLAIDIFQINDDGEGVWSVPFCKLLNKENEEAKELIKWGGDFKLRNGSRDYCHFEYNGPI